MSVRTMPMFYVACDECGVNAFADGEAIGWSDKESALEVFADSQGDWSEWEGQHRCDAHNPFCERCGNDAGELSGERDYLCSLCWDLVGDAGPP